MPRSKPHKKHAGGRPRSRPDGERSVDLRISVTSGERDDVHARAQAEGLPFAEWARRQLGLGASAPVKRIT